MPRTVEAIVEPDGRIRLLEVVDLQQGERALVVFPDLGAADSLASSRLSEEVLAKDWNRPEEEQAWSHLKP